MIALKFVLLIISVLTGYFLGYFFTETKYRLARYDVFKMTVWECRKCLSTHIAWVTSTLFATIFEDWLVFIIGLIFAAALFWGLYLDEKEKTVSLEDMDKILGE